MADIIESLQFFIDNWKTDFISISFIVAALFVISGYFYGKVMEKFCKPLKKADCTVLGVLFIFAAFQMVTFASVNLGWKTDIAYKALHVLFWGGPVLCLATLTLPLPSWKHLASLVVGIGVAWALCWGSSKLTTNSTFFDTVTYMSQVIESSKAEVFGGMSYTSGGMLSGIEPLHDYEGFYYLFAMVLRWVEKAFEIKTSLSPVYMWSATMLYGYCLGSLVVSAVNVTYRKMYTKWWGVVLSIGILAPYYTNYFNTTLGFFGQTYRQIISGASLMLVYLIVKKPKPLLFVVLGITYMAGICCSSSSFFISAFISLALFFVLCFKNTKDWKVWIGFILSCFPVFLYALMILVTGKGRFFTLLAAVLGLLLVLSGIAYLLKGHYKWFDLIGKILLPIVILAFVVLSVKYSKLEDCGYDFFFDKRSLSDMTVNYTAWVDKYEMWRNFILYGLLALSAVNWKKNRWFKLFIALTIVLFLNPLVQPAVNHFFTSYVYVRAFDLIANPFTITFLLCNVGELLPWAVANISLRWLILPIGASLCSWIGYQNLTIPYSVALTVKDEDYNWENKVGDDSYDMYTYISENIANGEDRHTFLSQDIDLKSYVPNIFIVFNSSQFRDAMADEENYNGYQDVVTLLHPFIRTEGQNVFDEEPDFSKLKDVVQKYQAEYLLMANTYAVWNERGWFEKSYAEIVALGMVEKEYENHTWILFKVNQDWKPQEEAEPVEETESEDEGEEAAVNSLILA